MQFLIRQLLKTAGVFTRTIRAVISRRVSGVTTRVRKLTNVSQQATRAATAAVQSATEVAKTPSKREDYVAFGNLLIAKSFLARLAIGLCVLGMLGYFVVWPFILSHFLTARFWEQDKRVPTWSGRVIVFSDKTKTVPLFSGKLREGKLQGDGKEYVDGVLAYEGGFLDGQRSGTGMAYEEGELVYEGQFAQGLWEGTGISYADGQKQYEGQFSAGKYHGRGTLYQDDALLYDGQFDHGLYEGQGSLYQAGLLSYEGAFREGTPQGMGTSYYYGGGVRYQGQFENGVPEGTGRAYEDGRMVYQGGFSKGLYSGTGTLYLSEGEQLQGEFLEGTPRGVMKWSKGGKLYYEGEWLDDRPAGYGILYAKSGEAAYRGAFWRGTIDGSSLLGMSADEVRRTLGEENTQNTAGGGSTFSISSPQLGLTAQCTYQTSAAPSQTVAVYLYEPQDGDDWFLLLPGEGRAAEPDEDARRGSTSYSRQDTVPLAPGQYESISSDTGNGTETVIFQRQTPVLVRWTGGSVGGGTTPASAAESAMAAALDALAGGVTGMDTVEDLLDALDSMASIPPSAPVEFGDAPVGDALAGCADMEAAADLLSAMSDYWCEAEKASLLTENLARTNALLEDARQAAAMGQGTAAAVASLEEEKHALEAQILDCELAKKKAESAAQAAAGGADAFPMDLTGMDLSETSTMFNPAGLDAAELPLVAAAYSQAKGGGSDSGDLEVQVKSALLTLQKGYEQAQAAIKQYEEAVKAADDAAKEYAMGTGSKAGWYKALSAKNDTRAALYSSMNEFTKQSADLNSVTGGWVSRRMNWHADAFAAVGEAEFPEGMPETAGSGTETLPEVQPVPEAPAQSPSEAQSGAESQPSQGAAETQPVQSTAEAQPDQDTADTSADAGTETDSQENHSQTPEEPSVVENADTSGDVDKDVDTYKEPAADESQENAEDEAASTDEDQPKDADTDTDAGAQKDDAIQTPEYPDGMTAEEWDALWGAPSAA